MRVEFEKKSRDKVTGHQALSLTLEEYIIHGNIGRLLDKPASQSHNSGPV
jgi:hypothetical protein